MLVLLVVWGLVPGLREVTETAVHFVRTGHTHAPHAPGSDGDLGHEAPEHSCGATLHQCGCCFGQPLSSGRPTTLAAAAAEWRAQTADRGAPAAFGALDRPFRPPIA